MAVDKAPLLLIQFSRSPQMGQVKTRMMPHLSAAEACDLHCHLTLWVCNQLLDCGLGAVELSVAGDPDHALFRVCKALGVARLTLQRGADLGERMFEAMAHGLAHYEYVILVGSDCPSIDGSYLEQAVEALQVAPVVLGPATDGGYVLIGAGEIKYEIFQDIAWGSDQVYRQTCHALMSSGLTWAELPYLSDIDGPEDLAVWETLQRARRDDQGV
ncbi:MAG: TIGR04282 family arsenosugar biosynthesis glycosyltransferase [Halioglobus sp.]|nr:TIGR04282 family arsenosugar biosynthesis glycosyltransferase [Halioglobus sp.]